MQVLHESAEGRIRALGGGLFHVEPAEQALAVLDDI